MINDKLKFIKFKIVIKTFYFEFIITILALEQYPPMSNEFIIPVSDSAKLLELQYKKKPILMEFHT